jgi:hypothetical protein
MSPLILSFNRVARINRTWALLLVAVVLAGCGRNGGIKVYRLANDQSNQSTSAPAADEMNAPAAGENAGAAAQPRLQWTLPAGWTEKPPTEMRLASFNAAGPDGKQPDVSVVPLPGLAGGDAANVNRWRGQVGLSDVTSDEIQKSAEAIQAGGQPAQLFDILGKNPDGSPARILAAIQHRGDTTWFFKMTGDAAQVEEQKPAFIAFLKLLQFSEAEQTEALPPGRPPIGGTGMNAPMMSSAGASAAKPAWTVPADWKEVPPAQFLLAEYAIAGANGAAAEVNVAELDGDGGGLLPNVNRWRRQIGLGGASEDDLAKLTTTIAGGQATLVDMTGTDAKTGGPVRLVGAMVPVGGQTWFYKLMGAPDVVAGQKDAFLKFIQTAKYSNAP